MEIDAVAVLDMVFHAGADAAPERFGRAAVGLEVSGFERDVVGHHAALRVLRGQNMVVQGTLIIVGIGWGGRPLEEVPGQLQHIIGVAGLRRAGAEVGTELAGCIEMLAVGVCPDHVGTGVNHAVPEKFGGGAVFHVPGQLIKARQADQLRDLRVPMQPGQFVFAACEWVENGFVIKFMRDV